MAAGVRKGVRHTAGVTRIVALLNNVLTKCSAICTVSHQDIGLDQCHST